MVAASAEAIAISSYAKDLGLDLSGEVYRCDICAHSVCGYRRQEYQAGCVTNIF